LANVTGTRLTLSDTVGLAVDMSPVIQLIDPFDVGLLSYIGLDSLSKPATATKHEWMEDTLQPLSDAVGEDLDDNETVVTVTDGTIFRANDVIMIDNELMFVQSIATNDLTVIRGYAGSTAAAHPTAVPARTVYIVAPSVLEGSGAGTARSTVKAGKYNYRQIVEEVIQVSSSLEAVEQWAPGSEYARQLSKKMKVIFIQLDRLLIFGKTYAGTASIPPMMGGLLHYITTNVTAVGGAQLSEKIVLDSLNLTYDSGGNVTCMAMVLKQKQALNKFLDPQRRTSIDQRQAGSIVDSYLWDHGIVDTVIDRWLPTDYVLYLTKEHIGMGPALGQNLGHEILPKTSRLFIKGQITGEFTAEVKSEKSHAINTGLATTIV
jgi:hypothetical protein